MTYDLGSEIDSLNLSTAAKKRLVTVLKDIIKKPGCLKYAYHVDLDQIELNVKTDQYEGEIYMFHKQQSKIMGCVKNKEIPQSVVFEGEFYSTRFIDETEDTKGIYQISFGPAGQGKMKTIVTYYDGEVLDYCKSIKIDGELLSKPLSIKEQLRPRGILPDYELELAANGEEFTVNPDRIVSLVNYIRSSNPEGNIIEEGPKL